MLQQISHSTYDLIRKLRFYYYRLIGKFIELDFETHLHTMYTAQDHHSRAFKIIIANDVRSHDINVR